MYLVAVLGNLLIIVAIISDSHLHTPMYFFLSNLSLADIGFISTTVPKMILDIPLQSKIISFKSCLTQMSLFLIFGCMDDMLLTVMAYDRFVAICHPLQYHVIMNPRLCVFLVMVSLLFSLLESQLHNMIVLHFKYFEDSNISNFFCEPSQLLYLICSNNFTKNIVTYFVSGVIYGFLPLSGIFFSYYKIVCAVLRISSSSGKYKAFSTCGSHFSVFCLFYGTAFGVYFTSPKKISVASVMYTMVIPMLNPFIYSLRNQDMKHALRRLQSRAM
ncbi:putative gustatory receptor clone PTE01 [Fukomys damarensis]|uniref:putative gustatory receptor clone PTE01 n=1 Tax=Fukomys damarensis TaxID=885580 RepID=UPI0014556353|nr:putative gustatory receptor clone PTE01 [Fukomys damarensis]